MKRIILPFVFALILAGCGANLPTLNLTSSVTLNSVEAIVAGYGTALAGENTLKQTPLCKTGTTFSFLSNVCVKRSTIVKMQQKDLVANAAVNNLVSFVKAYPSVDPTTYISAARSALLDLQDVINTGKAGG